MSAEGELTTKRLKTDKPSPRRPAPKLAPWKRLSVCSEPIDDELQWKKLDRPRDVDRLGLHYGYAWYRMVLDQPRQAKKNLFLPDCADRGTIFLNGDLLGVWGVRGKRTPIPATFKRGRNVLTVLTDNLGRLNITPDIGELKGLYGHVYDAKSMPAMKFKLHRDETLSRRVIPRHKNHFFADFQKLPLVVAETEIKMTKVTPIHLAFETDCAVAVLCNDKPVDLLDRGYGAVTLGAELKSGRNVIRLLLFKENVTIKDLSVFKFHQLTESVTQDATWSFRPWMLPELGGRVVGKGLPAWYGTTFKYTPDERPLFVHVIGAKKGQLFLNGRNLGRFWTIGPQQYYYLPECWLSEENELSLFDEGGDNPSGSQLSFKPLGPFKD
jgi:beta-galactosidase